MTDNNDNDDKLKIKEKINSIIDRAIDRVNNNDNAGKLIAKGRIMEQTTYQLDGHSYPIIGVKYNKFGRVDGAKLMSYDSDSDTVTIRVDHSETPSFWLEIQLPVNRLTEWVKNIDK